MAEPPDLGREFREAAEAALTSARQGLILEHERLMAVREASLRMEIALLREELSCLRGGDTTTTAFASTMSEGGVKACRRTWPSGRSSFCSEIGELRPSALLRPSTATEPGAFMTAGGHTRSTTHTFQSTKSCQSECEVTWKKTAGTVISRAGSEFFSRTSGPVEVERSTKSGASFLMGFGLRLRKDTSFQLRIMESIMGCVIMLNTMTLGLSSELHPEHSMWIIVDSVFAGIFTVELITKLSIFGARAYILGSDSRWNNFELVLVVIAWVEVCIASMHKGSDTGASKSSLIRMLRLLRLTKLLRVLRLQVFCDLLMMVNGAIGSWKTLLYSMVLIFIPLYGVSLILTETLGDHAEQGQGADCFSHVVQAFFTLFRCIVVGECTQEDGKPIFVMVTATYGWSYGVLYCLVQLLMQFGLFNVIVAIYVENIVSAAKYNDLFVKRSRLRDRAYFQDKAQDLLKLIWKRHQAWQGAPGGRFSHLDESAASRLLLTQEFFDALCKESSFTDILRDLDISEDDQLDLFETLDVEGSGTIGLMDLVIGIGKLRGEARKADIVSVGLLMRSLQIKIMQMEGRMLTSVNRKEVSFTAKSTRSNTADADDDARHSENNSI